MSYVISGAGGASARGSSNQYPQGDAAMAMDSWVVFMDSLFIQYEKWNFVYEF
jgi:hypothetical protein